MRLHTVANTSLVGSRPWPCSPPIFQTISRSAIGSLLQTNASSMFHATPAGIIRPMHNCYTGYVCDASIRRSVGNAVVLLQHLETFVRVVEEGNFTRAGELLNLSQPAVTRQVAALEHDLGASL